LPARSAASAVLQFRLQDQGAGAPRAWPEVSSRPLAPL